MKLTTIIGIAAAVFAVGAAIAQTDNQPLREINNQNAPGNNNVIDEVAWVVGDEPIYKSEIEDMYMQAKLENISLEGNPYCIFPEKIAVEKLYLHQAKIDTIEAPEAMVNSAVERRINYYISGLGSKERVEELFHKPMPQLREQMYEVVRNQYIIESVQNNLTKDVKATPNDVKKYFVNLPADSIPYVPMQVEVQIISLNPIIPQSEIENVKDRLRDFTKRINSGDTDFSTLAIMYSEDGSSINGGELGFSGKADFVPEFSNVAFNLNDPKKVSRIVETEYGFHIIQLIEKRGDQINCRHILLRPKVKEEDINNAMTKMDSVRTEIMNNNIDFNRACYLYSQDKDTRNNKGIMMNPQTGSNQFEMQQLPQEIAAVVGNMSPGEISKPFVMTDPKRNKKIVVITKLTKRIDGHKANLSEDFNMLKQMSENAKREQILKDWVENKIKDTYVRIEDSWKNCEFRYSGWEK